MGAYKQIELTCEHLSLAPSMWQWKHRWLSSAFLPFDLDLPSVLIDRRLPAAQALGSRSPAAPHATSTRTTERFRPRNENRSN